MCESRPDRIACVKKNKSIPRRDYCETYCPSCDQCRDLYWIRVGLIQHAFLGFPPPLLKTPHADCKQTGDHSRSGKEQTRQFGTCGHSTQRHCEIPPSSIARLPEDAQSIDAKERETNQTYIDIGRFAEPEHERAAKPKRPECHSQQSAAPTASPGIKTSGCEHKEGVLDHLGHYVVLEGHAPEKQRMVQIRQDGLDDPHDRDGMMGSEELAGH